MKIEDDETAPSTSLGTSRIKLVSTMAVAAKLVRACLMNPEHPLVIGVAAPTTAADAQILADAKAKAGRTRFRLGLCHVNAQRLALAHERVSYVEGFAGPYWTPHAWNLIDGRIVDVTWRDRGLGRMYVGLAFTRMAVSTSWRARGSGLVEAQILGHADARELEDWVRESGALAGASHGVVADAP